MSKNELTPFVKWAGGKKQLIKKIKNKMPNKFGTFYEPFIGGGAVFLNAKPENGVINDINKELINVYRQLKNDPIPVIKAVNELDKNGGDKEYYYLLRDKYNKKIFKKELDVECAALLIWINKHCFNGLYRVNSKGFFNVPYNNKTTGKSIDENNLIRIGHYLKESNIDIKCEDFEKCCKDVKEGDFVYFDSPYLPVSETAQFTDYTKNGFSMDDHIRLSELFEDLDRRGAKIMLSNHDVKLVYKLYGDYNIESIDVKRSINSNAEKRFGKEVIITNYTV